MDAFENKIIPWLKTSQTISEELRTGLETLQAMIYSGGEFRPFDLTAKKAERLRKRLRFVPKDQNRADAFFCKVVQSLLHNGVIKSNMNVVMYNVPSGLDCKDVWDSLKISEANPERVCKIDETTYSVRFADEEEAKRVADVLNKKLFGENIITVRYTPNPIEEADDEEERTQEQTERNQLNFGQQIARAVDDLPGAMNRAMSRLEPGSIAVITFLIVGLAIAVARLFT